MGLGSGLGSGLGLGLGLGSGSGSGSGLELGWSARLLEVEHDVELAHVLEVTVESLDQRVDELEARQLVLR